MTNKNKTHITVVLDRSGSMSNIAKDMEGGLKSLVEEQKKQPGECTFTFIKFDHVYEKVIDFQNILEVNSDNLILEPRGGTALVDALGKAINETGFSLAQLPEEERPALVTFVVITDGGENSSLEFTSQQVKDMIERQENVYKWEFNYLGANQNSFMEAGKYGFSIKKVSNYTSASAGDVLRNFSGKMVAARRMVSIDKKADLSYNSKDYEDLNK